MSGLLSSRKAHVLPSLAHAVHAAGRIPQPNPLPPATPPRLLPLQEQRGDADSYLFDLSHFLLMHIDANVPPRDRARLPSLPCEPTEDAEHLVIDAHETGAWWVGWSAGWGVSISQRAALPAYAASLHASGTCAGPRPPPGPPSTHPPAPARPFPLLQAAWRASSTTRARPTW